MWSLLSQRRGLWLTLIVVSGTPRILAALFLPNTFGDAYVYIRDIGVMSMKLKTGTFAFTDFYGFWLPLYQFLSAVLNVFVGNGFYAGKVVSAGFGVGVCLYVYAITMQVTQHRKAAMLAFLLIAFNPVHILTSASALTDVPHAFFVLASLSFVLKRSWRLAASLPRWPDARREREAHRGNSASQFFGNAGGQFRGCDHRLPPLVVVRSWKAAGMLACFKSRQIISMLAATNSAGSCSLPAFSNTAIFVFQVTSGPLAAFGWLVSHRANDYKEKKYGRFPKSQHHSAVADFLLRLLRSARGRVCHTPAANHLSTLWPDTFQPGDSGPRLDVLRCHSPKV